MDVRTKKLIVAVNRLTVTPAEDAALAGEIKKSVASWNLARFEDLRFEYWIAHIARSLSRSAGRDQIEASDREDARNIALIPTNARDKKVKRLHDTARQAWNRFCKKHSTGSLETKGGDHGQKYIPSIRYRPLIKEAKSITDCRDSKKRLQLSQKYLADQIGRALALLDALNVSREKLPQQLVKPKQMLEQVSELLGADWP